MCQDPCACASSRHGPYDRLVTANTRNRQLLELPQISITKTKNFVSFVLLMSFLLTNSKKIGNSSLSCGYNYNSFLDSDFSSDTKDSYFLIKYLFYLQSEPNNLVNFWFIRRFQQIFITITTNKIGLPRSILSHTRQVVKKLWAQAVDCLTQSLPLVPRPSALHYIYHITTSGI